VQRSPTSCRPSQLRPFASHISAQAARRTRIAAPELETLVDKIRTAESSVTILIGERGSGKSALLAALDERLRNHTIAVLSIKSDRIAPTVMTAAALAEILACRKT